MKEISKEHKTDIFNNVIKNINYNAKIINHINNHKIKAHNKILFYLNLIVLIQILPKKYNSSYIELTISGPGTKKIFNDKGKTSFAEANFPSEVYINNDLQGRVNSEYPFRNSEAYIVKLVYDTVDNMEEMFHSCIDIKKIDLSHFDSSSVTTMQSAFYNCLSLEEINSSNMNTSKVKCMSHMFENCIKIKNIDLSSFDMSQIDDIRGLFKNCESLISINLSNFKKSTVREMSSVFHNCYSLTSVDLSNLETDKLEYIGSIFRECKLLEFVDLSKINTNKVKNMDFMFYNCKLLTSLNLSNFDTSTVTWIESMFDGCENLEYINLNNFYINNTINNRNIFRGTPDNLFICPKDLNEENLASLLTNKTCFSYTPTNIPNKEKKEIIYFTENSKYSCNLYELCYKVYNNCDIEVDRLDYNLLTCDNKLSIELKKINYNKKINCHEYCNYYYCFDNSGNSKCSDYCEISDLLNEKCIINNIVNKNDKEIIQIQDKILHNINKSFTSSNYNTNNIDNGVEEIIKCNKLTITLTTTENQNNNIDNNVTTIDLIECEKVLRYIYNISDDKKIYLMKIDAEQDKMKIPKIEYDVYYKENETNLTKN